MAVSPGLLVSGSASNRWDRDCLKEQLPISAPHSFVELTQPPLPFFCVGIAHRSREPFWVQVEFVVFSIGEIQGSFLDLLQRQLRREDHLVTLASADKEPHSDHHCEFL